MTHNEVTTGGVVSLSWKWIKYGRNASENMLFQVGVLGLYLVATTQNIIWDNGITKVNYLRVICFDQYIYIGCQAHWNASLVTRCKLNEGRIWFAGNVRRPTMHFSFKSKLCGMAHRDNAQHICFFFWPRLETIRYRAWNKAYIR